MKNNAKKIMRSIALALSVAMVCGCADIVSYADKDASCAAATAAGKQVSSEVSSVSANTDINKDETVYVIAAADGSAKQLIVSDRLDNPSGEQTITDKTALKNIVNVDGDETFNLDSGTCVWNAQGNDICYQGNISKDLPVSMKISFTLDGKSVSADELAGKSGKVTIRFDYTDNECRYVGLDGKQQKIYVPFLVLSGAVLDSSRFSNIEVSNGKLLNNGNNTIVVGFAMPGLREDLNLNDSDFTIPGFVEITADVTDFALSTTLTVATNEPFNEINLSGVSDKISDMTGSLDDLENAMNQLLDGSSALCDGMRKLLDSSNDLIAGISSLSAGAKKLSEGAGSLKNGAADLNAGAVALASGLSAISANSASLNGGAKQVFDSLLSEAYAQLTAAGLTVPSLTISNYATVLNGVLASLNETAVRNTATQAALNTVTQAVRANEAAIRAQVTSAVQANVLEGVLTAAGLPMTAEQYAAAVSAGTIPAATQNQISAAVDAQMQSPTILTQIDQLTETQIQSLISQNMQSADVTSQISAAVTRAQAASAKIAALKTQLDSYNTFYQGLLTYTGGVDRANTGAASLASGSQTLSDGAASVSEGADTLYSGMKSLLSGSQALIDGITKLKNGAVDLSDGLSDFNKEGIQKLVETFNGKLGVLFDRLNAAVDASKQYNNFSGMSDGMSGSVKFVYKTDSIGK